MLVILIFSVLTGISAKLDARNKRGFFVWNISRIFS